MGASGVLTWLLTIAGDINSGKAIWKCMKTYEDSAYMENLCTSSQWCYERQTSLTVMMFIWHSEYTISDSVESFHCENY